MTFLWTVRCTTLYLLLSEFTQVYIFTPTSIDNLNHNTTRIGFNPLRPNGDPSQNSHCNIKGLSVSEVMRIENIITQVKFY